MKIYNESNKVYGAPKIQKELEGKGHKVSVKRVQRKMKELGIRSIVTKKFRPTRSSQKVDEKPNLLNQDFSVDKPNKKWVGDITYIHIVKHGWCYLAAVLDNAYVNQRPEKRGGIPFGSWKTIHEQRLYKAIKKIQDATIS